MKKSVQATAQLQQLLKPVLPVIGNLVAQGAQVYLVGGCVRDLVLGIPLSDLDIEVHRMSLADLRLALSSAGPVLEVGQKFGVLRIGSIDIDWSLPRTDSTGRKPEVAIDPFMGIAKACARRDVTMNAMALDCSQLLTGTQDVEIIDPFGGLEAIERKVLCAVDPVFFVQDPLRFFRVMQFVARFEMDPDAQLNEVCARMNLWDEYLDKPLARERIWAEMHKLLMRSAKPSLGFYWVKHIGRLTELFPPLGKLVGVPQRHDYHPEGDVFVHSMQALDAAAQLIEYVESSWGSAEKERWLISLAALCHDLGKATTTNPDDLTCHGHDTAGVQPARELLKLFTGSKDEVQAVCTAVLLHMLPFALVKQNSSLRAYKRLALRAAPHLWLRHLGLLSLCDASGRNGNDPTKPLPFAVSRPAYEAFIAKALEAHVLHGPLQPLLTGKDFLDVAPPGPELGRLVKRAYELQIEEQITDPVELKRRVLGQ